MRKIVLFSWVATAAGLFVTACDGSSTGSAGAAGSTSSNAGSGGENGGSGGTGASAAGSGGSTGGTSSGGTTASSGGSTATSMGECTKGEKEACYTGPNGTEGVGICKPGERTCKTDGTWGLCLGEVTPLSESCNTPGDDDCDGLVNEDGDGCVCTPWTMSACYTGPMGTQDVGVCKGGMALCNPDGLGFGACEGQIVPVFENCLAPADENCDGTATACTGDDLFHKRFGDAGAQQAAGVASSNGGGAVIAGAFAGTVDFGGGGLVSAGGNDAFVASYDYLGAHVWSKRFGDTVAQASTSVTVDADGNVIVVGDYAGKVDLGAGMITSAGLTDIFVAKYTSAGALVWAKSFGDTKAQNVPDVAVDANGRVGIVGTFAGDLAFGGDLLTSAGGTDIFVAVFDKDGTHVWSKRFGDAAAQVGKSIGFGPAGETVIAGDNSGAIDFGGGALTTAGAADVVLASFDANGTALWSKQFGNNVAQVANAVDVDSVGNVALAASFAGKINFGGGDLTSAGGNDIAVAKFTSGGMVLWAKRFGANGADNARGVAFDPFGAVLMTGDFTGSVDFGGGALASAGGTDIVVAKYDALSAHVWSKRAGDAGAQVAAAIDADATGVVITGTFAGTVNFGGGALTSAGGNDVFLVKLAQ
ncbi:MAG: nucleotide-binding protein [Polyangiaceae bacterium]|nr:nucleotide-binding protein [Polyangiaceae bacterium]